LENTSPNNKEATKSTSVLQGQSEHSYVLSKSSYNPSNFIRNYKLEETIGPLGQNVKSYDNGNKLSYGQTLDNWIMISHKLASENKRCQEESRRLDNRLTSTKHLWQKDIKEYQDQFAKSL
jgi:hypothetical protein